MGDARTCRVESSSAYRTCAAPPSWRGIRANLVPQVRYLRSNALEDVNTTIEDFVDATKIAEIKKRIQADAGLTDVQKKFCDDACIKRFLRARKSDVPKVRRD